MKAHILPGKLDSIQLPDPDGNYTRLGELWRSQPTLLVFLRHFG